MKPGTPGFVGLRLKKARELRGLTAIALAGVTEVSRQAISQYESNQQTPHPEVMSRLMKVLNLPMTWFTRPVEVPASIDFFRCMSSTTKAARTMAAQTTDILYELTDYVGRFINLPKVDFPSWETPDDPTALTDEQIEDFAEKTRRYWGLQDGPISNVVWLLENHGAIVSRMETGADELDGLSRVLGEQKRPFILLASDKCSAVRSRHDAAHELGHILLHRKVTQKHLNCKATYKLLETQAHRFGAAFLLPAKAFAADMTWPSLDCFRVLKEKWKVSMALMIMRAAHLQFISEDQARSLWINYARRGFKKREPLDDTLPIEQPRLLRKAFELLVKEQVQSPQDILTDIGLHSKDAEKMACLPPGFFNQDAEVIRLADLIVDKAKPISQDDGRPKGAVLQFPTKQAGATSTVAVSSESEDDREFEPFPRRRH